MKFGIETDGFDELEKKLRTMGKEVGESTDKATKVGALFVRERQESNAPKKNITDVEKVSSDNHSAIYHIGLVVKEWFYRFFEFGATPHEIEGSPLVFEGSSGLVFTKKVEHPGMTAQPFIKLSLSRKNSEVVSVRMGNFFMKIIGRFLT